MKCIWIAIRRHLDPGYETEQEKAARIESQERWLNSFHESSIRKSIESLHEMEWLTSSQFQGHRWAHEKYWGNK